MSLGAVEISVVIPVMNEAQHIRNTLALIAAFVSQSSSSFEVIVIDDGSTDGTWDALCLAASDLPQVYGIRLSRNFGKERALCAGIEHAKGKAVLVMDADLQHPPELISKMIDQWRNDGVQVVEAVKRTRGRESLGYRVGTKMFYGLIHRLTRYDLNGASDFKLLDRKVVDAWLNMPERATFFRGMTAWLGFTKKELEFDVAPRTSGTSKWHFISLVRLALNAVVSFTSWPLRLVTLIGILFFLGAVILGIQTLYMKLSGSAVTGFTTVILLLLGMNSVIMLSIGILGEYIAAIYDEVKGRPRYVVRENTSTLSQRWQGKRISVKRVKISQLGEADEKATTASTR
ncbi:glycosyltransferase family 2 protein [Alicyclobacillus fodiniaquatilis]|uniref:Glycosyltransferase family 2 protein n=1 Tax=Alicyclobacillus fodiniaquatilis TaxID=1661150 RepID=A0ABW4JRM3_9BACL